MPSLACRTTLLMLALTAGPALAQDTFRWSGRVAAGDRVEVVGISADIAATPATGDQVQVSATGLSDGARIEIDEHAGGVSVCVIHPGMHRRADGGRCSLEGRGGRNRRESRIRVQLRVPSGVRLAASTVSGDITAEELGSDVEVRSVSGDVRVSTRGVAEAASVSGDVTVRVGRLPRNGSLEFRSVSGDVEVTLPSGADAEVRASSLSGEIESDFPLEVNEGRRSGRRGFEVRVGNRARGTLGDGGARLDLESVSGDISLRRAR